MAKTEDRFLKIYTQGNVWSSTTEIWIDRETGVHYLWHRDGTSAGLTPLLKADGSPVVTPVSRCDE